jgi:hypothetical protein
MTETRSVLACAECQAHWYVGHEPAVLGNSISSGGSGGRVGKCSAQPRVTQGPQAEKASTVEDFSVSAPGKVASS